MSNFDDPVTVTRRFLGQLRTGCVFAAAFAQSKAGPILWAELTFSQGFGADHALAIQRAFCDAAAKHLAVGLVFPSAQSEEDLCALVVALAGLDGWSVAELSDDERPKDLPGDVRAFSLFWRTETGRDASVMVLGPFGLFPVHRRAPYLTLMSWTGERCNDLLIDSLAKEERPIGFVDMPVNEPHRESYQTMWDKSRDNAKRMRLHSGAPANKGARPNVAFCVSPKAAKRLHAALTQI